MSEDQQQNQQGEEKRQLTALEQLTRPAEEFVNDATVEAAWLSTAVRHMEAYYRLISSVKEPASLRLTPNDDLIYGAFREAFPELNVELLTEEAIKSTEGKWGRTDCSKQLFSNSSLSTLTTFYSKSQVAPVLQRDGGQGGGL